MSQQSCSAKVAFHTSFTRGQNPLRKLKDIQALGGVTITPSNPWPRPKSDAADEDHVLTITAPTPQRLQEALDAYMSITYGRYKYRHTRVRFFVKKLAMMAKRKNQKESNSSKNEEEIDRSVEKSGNENEDLHQECKVRMQCAQANLSHFQDSKFTGCYVPFGVPVCCSPELRLAAVKVSLGDDNKEKEDEITSSNNACIAGVHLMDTSFVACTDGPQGEMYWAHYVDLELVLTSTSSDENPETGKPSKSTKELSLSSSSWASFVPPPLLKPEEIPSYGLNPPCTGTDLVIFCICTKPNPANAKDPYCLLILELEDCWFMPAGHVERGQSFADACVAEMAEESGYSLKMCPKTTSKTTSAPLSLTMATAEPDIVPYDLIYGANGYDGYEHHCAPIHVLYHGFVDEDVPPIPAVDGKGCTWVPLQLLLQALNGGNPNAESMKEIVSGGYLGEVAEFRKPWEMEKVFRRFAEYWVSHYLPFSSTLNQKVDE